MYFKSLIILICISIFKLNTVIALTQDLSLTILVKSSITMEYVLAKSVCKLLDRELRISHSFGGSGNQIKSWVTKPSAAKRLNQITGSVMVLVGLLLVVS